MKKIISLIAIMLVSAAAFVGCTKDSFGIEYAFETNGVTNGHVNIEFVGGEFGVNGEADFNFNISNVTDTTARTVSLTEALQNTNDEEVYRAACKVNEWMDTAFAVTDFSGTYDIYVKGYVMETFTQIKFSIDRRFTNLPEE